MFFLLVTANLTLYVSSAQLLFNNSWVAGLSTLVGGVSLSLFSKLGYSKLKKKGKIGKKVCDGLDCFDNCDCVDCDCGGCDC
ncbi:hypothetical protein SAMN05444392_10521 [Seinonella peptonophila]|uniref:Uncharacterized protein n=1 Tax=Seinonella peptonophila TaxID=112248 RepID=A0A1M4XIB0_9BACL|nr:hypothetical protein [Seinonella peptonophila]SHE93294.1 hypothetical protein SAMN05444392_10521 [Seinonella peptonophila]